MKKYCANCGNPMDEDAKFCPSCGVGQESYRRYESSTSTTSTSNGKDTARSIFGALIIGSIIRSMFHPFCHHHHHGFHHHHHHHW